MRDQGARNCIIVRELGIPESTLRGWLYVNKKTNSQSQGQKRRRKESDKVEEHQNCTLRAEPLQARKRQQVKSVANQRFDENSAFVRAAEVIVPEIDAAKIKPIIETVDQDTFLSWLGVYAPNNVPLSKPRGRTRSATAEFRNAK